MFSSSDNNSFTTVAGHSPYFKSVIRTAQITAADARILAATHRNLLQIIEDGTFDRTYPIV